MAYKIRVDYSTGDSFKTYETETILPLQFTNIDIAKENLVRIQKHYIWYTQGTRSYDPVFGEIPDFVKENNTEVYREFKCYGKVCKEIVYEAAYYIFLLDDNRNEVKIATSWIGYFEGLIGAEIISKQDDGWSFKVNHY